MSEQVSDPLRPLADVLKPDDRQPNLPQGLSDVHSRLEGMCLHSGVPLGVRQLFETAKNVRLYTFFVYRFHQIAEMAAYQALEMSLLMRWKKEHPTEGEDDGRRLPTMGPLLRDALAAGWFPKDEFSGRYWRAERMILAKTTDVAMQAMMDGRKPPKYVPPDESEIEAIAESIDVGRLLVELVPKMRNDLAHGSAKLAPISDYVLQDVCDAINVMWER